MTSLWSKTATTSPRSAADRRRRRIRIRCCCTLGPDERQRYIIDEVQKVYRSQGVNTNDKHIEVICRQMLRKVQHPVTRAIPTS